MENIEEKRFWVDDFTYEDFVDFLDGWQVLYFNYKGKDYMFEPFTEGYLLADPIVYYKNGGFPDDPIGQYPESFQAKNADEFLSMPFLEGRTVKEAWNDIKIWDF